MGRITPQTSQQDQILTQLTSLAISFAAHVAGEAQSNEQIKAMYKILVTGNGVPPLPEIVRNHTEWIAERDAERQENKVDKKEEVAQNKIDVKADRREAVSSKHQLWILVGTQVLGFLLIGLEILLHWK